MMQGKATHPRAGDPGILASGACIAGSEPLSIQEVNRRIPDNGQLVGP